MAYDETNNRAATALEDGSGGGDNAGKDTFFLPGDFCGDKEYKAGDTITLRVVAPADDDGDVEVAMSKGEDMGSDWKSDLRETVTDDGSGGMM